MKKIIITYLQYPDYIEAVLLEQVTVLWIFYMWMAKEEVEGYAHNVYQKVSDWKTEHQLGDENVIDMVKGREA